MDLFAPADDVLTPIPLDDGELYFLARPAALPEGDILARLIGETAWRAETITLWGRRYLQPRLIAWQGEAAYRYSGLTLTPQPFSPLLRELRGAVQRATGRRFNSVLLNCYRDQRDSMGMHSDDEPELGPEPAIASLSFGAARTFTLKHKRLPKTLKLQLGDGNLLLMAGKTQQNWRHGIAKTRRPCGPRVNLTFRNIA
ncbi:MAG: alpha-ketoglutarate-dependent dioxygenase AlkB [Burkholderiaceae bacterium]|nr:alpha-ketoglutarate-dependent dioxygenase AlkB [Burkholderiaceae bacterium]